MHMPCCPEDGQHAEHDGHAHDGHDSQSDATVACDPLATEALSPSLLDIPQTPALASELPAWLTRRPPPPALAEPSPHPSPPIYLIKLRLRI